MIDITIGLFAYLSCEILIRWLSYDYVGIGNVTGSIKEYKWECWKDVVIIVSPGYWLARYFKSDIKKHTNYLPCHLGRYIKFNNYFNVWFSLILFFVLTYSWLLQSSPDFIESFVYWRFISRSIEISYAFGNDAVNGHANKNSNLTKHDRIKLALLSYMEIFIYSACFLPSYGSEFISNKFNSKISRRRFVCEC